MSKFFAKLLSGSKSYLECILHATIRMSQGIGYRISGLSLDDLNETNTIMFGGQTTHNAADTFLYVHENICMHIYIHTYI